MINSDGYIMLDFIDVDFRQTNQHIEGLFDRLSSVIGTNKFVLVVNANGKTPMPSAVSITNGQFVIESYIYTFSVNSSDMLHITKHSNVDDIIDDDHASISTTYSSTKIINVVNGLIDDQHQTTTTTWSSDRIMTVLGLNIAPFQFMEKKAQLNVGSQMITWNDDSITSDMWVLPFTSEYGINPSSITCSDGSCSMTFNDPLDHVIDVGVRLYKPLTQGG